MVEPALTDRQRQHVRALSDRYTRRTARSRSLAMRCREYLADPRSAGSLRPETVDMCYPLAARRSEGARFWDIDDNCYVDISMGLGTHLFGHRPRFLTDALSAQLDLGIHLGPRSARLGEVARRICALTGAERMVICNSGTHAVATAIRLARAATGRATIALFRESYHGHAIETLAYAPPAPETARATPLGPGIPSSTAGHTLVLTYGDDRALTALDAHASELAAVLVEPVQTRRPDLQPAQFLHRLRRWTQEHGVALIFDEVVTGFRVHPRGAQGLFEVTADLAVYGKLLAAGLPVGVTAGRAEYIDAIDGGVSRGGDLVAQGRERVVFGGTFNGNPMTIAAMLAVLDQLEARSPGLQQELTRTTAALAAELDEHFERHRMPVRVAHFGSLFRFMPPSGGALFLPLDIELLHYHLLDSGFYVWEGRLCFLSTAHTPEDVRDLARAVKRSTLDLQDAGFLTP